MKPARHSGLRLAALLLGCAAAAARAEVVSVVSARSPVTALSQAQIADIFLGRSNRFADGSRAIPIDLPEDSSARDSFYVQVTGKSRAQLKAHWSRMIFTGKGQPPRIVADSVELKKLLATNPSAICYLDESQVDSSLRVIRAP